MVRTGGTHVRSLAIPMALILVAVSSGCSAAEDLLEEQTGSTIDVTIPDLNSPDFTMPEIVAPDINIDIDQLQIEAPEIPPIRFPDAVTIEIPQITSPEVEVAETEDETIYTVSGRVLFDFDEANLRPDAIEVLEEVLAAIEERGYGGTIEIAGHTDSVGTAEYNYDLSVRRATGVALWFRERIPADQDIQAIGYGESTPIAPNENEDGTPNEENQAENRRVEIIVNK